MRAQVNVKQQLGLKDELEDILITLTTQYHLFRVLQSDPKLYLYLVLNRSQANLAMARRALGNVEAGLVV